MTYNRKLVYIVILNWNGWSDTIECLESVFRLNYVNFRVIVCDNNSSDGSLDYIKAWADGLLEVYSPYDNQLRHLTFPSIPKPIPYIQYDNKNAIAERITNADDLPLILIQTGANLGFAGGNNAGLLHALRRNDSDYVWLLNNDTVTEPNSLTALVEKAEQLRSTGSKIGIIGSKLMYYHNPEVFQGVGGTYNKWFATANHIGIFEKDNAQYDNDSVIDSTDYPLGASMLVSTAFIQDIGPMSEDYFLYYEEMDWVARGKAKGWEIGYCWMAKVFHKEGASIGTSAKGSEKSELSDYYGLRNRLLFTNKHYPHYMWCVRLGFIAVLFNRIRRKHYKRVLLVLKVLANKSIPYERLNLQTIK